MKLNIAASKSTTLSSNKRKCLFTFLAIGTLAAQVTTADKTGFVQRLIANIESSQIDLGNQTSNVPFPPLGYAAFSNYGNASIPFGDEGAFD